MGTMVLGGQQIKQDWRSTLLKVFHFIHHFQAVCTEIDDFVDHTLNIFLTYLHLNCFLIRSGVCMPLGKAHN